MGEALRKAIYGTGWFPKHAIDCYGHEMPWQDQAMKYDWGCRVYRREDSLVVEEYPISRFLGTLRYRFPNPKSLCDDNSMLLPG